jgi:hypothetical protein
MTNPARAASIENRCAQMPGLVRRTKFERSGMAHLERPVCCLQVERRGINNA